MLKELQKEMTKIFLPKTKRVPTCMVYLSYVVVAIVIYAIYDIFFKGRRFEGYDNPNKILTFFSMEGCGHCNKMKPEWDNFSKNNTTSIKTKIIDSNSPEFEEHSKKHDIKGFPTILLLNEKGDKLKDYDGGRNSEELHKFCKENDN